MDIIFKITKFHLHKSVTAAGTDYGRPERKWPSLHGTEAQYGIPSCGVFKGGIQN